MNINLSAAASKKKSDGTNANVGYGLNRRGVQSVFQGDSDSGEDDPGNGGTRDGVNRDLATEQAALRKRAQAAAMDDIYDYDGAYDDIHAQREQEEKQRKEARQKDRSSRYVQDLLNASKKRERERDAIYERKIAREQAEEDAMDDYRGKDKFITKAYKRKLAEREQWAKEDEKQRLLEEKEDVSKKKSGEAFASFYGNLNRNVAVGGMPSNSNSLSKEADEHKGKSDKATRPQKEGSRMAFLEGFTRGDPSTARSDDTGSKDAIQESPAQTEEEQRAAARKAREEKVAQARIRYFQRRGISNFDASAKQ